MPSDRLHVRIADGADRGALAALRRRSREEDGGPIDDDGFEERWLEWFDRERAQRVFFVAEVDGRPVGMTNLLVFERMPVPGRPAGQWGYLANMYVMAEHRDGGIGSALLDHLLDHARALGLVRVVLSPTVRSIPFYERAGFRPADELLVLHFETG